TTLLLFLFSLLLRAASFTLFPYTTLFRSSRLFERAAVHARNEGVSQLFIHALSENTAMLKIARNAGAVLERAGSETEAHLRLPRSEEHTSELQSRENLVCRLLLEKKNTSQ